MILLDEGPGRGIRIRNDGPSGPAPFDPLALSPYQLCDFSDASSVTLNGSTVALLDDLSGNSLDLGNATALQQPGYLLAAQNGRNVGDFDGIDDRLFTANTLTLAQPFVKFVVCKTADAGVQSNIYGQGAAPEFYRAATGQWGLWAGAGPILRGADDNAWHVFTILVNGAASTIRQDGVLLGVPGNVGATGYAAAALYLGSNSVGSQRLTGQVGMVMTAPVPTDDLRDAMESYLLDWWGI